MTLSHDPERFQGEGETRVDQMTREACEQDAAIIEAAEQELREAARAIANKVALAGPQYIDLLNTRTKRFPLQVDEAIEGFVERVIEQFGDLLNEKAVERARSIAKTGRDDD